MTLSVVFWADGEGSRVKGGSHCRCPHHQTGNVVTIVDASCEGKPMVTCQTCHGSSADMKTCDKCKETWCASCAHNGRGPYPKSRAANICPYCNSTAVKPAK